MQRESAIVHQIYDAALNPDLWEGVLEGLADLVGGDAANLTSWNVAAGTGSMTTARVDPALLALYWDNYTDLNPRLKDQSLTAIVRPHGTVFTDEEWQERETYIRSVFHNEFMRKLNGDWSLCIQLQGEVSDVSTVVIARRKARFEAHDIQIMRRLQPHLARSYRIGGQLAASHRCESSAWAALNQSGHAVFLLNRAGALRQTNTAGERLVRTGHGLSVVRGILTANQPATARRLSTLIARAASIDMNLRTGGTMQVISPGQRLPLLLTVIPVDADRPGLFTADPGVLVSVACPPVVASPGPETLQLMFDLTPAESRVAIAIFDGLAPKEIASRLGLSHNTIRVQLASVFSKTGARRQAELVRIMTDAAGPTVALET